MYEDLWTFLSEWVSAGVSESSLESISASWSGIQNQKVSGIVMPWFVKVSIRQPLMTLNPIEIIAAFVLAGTFCIGSFAIVFYFGNRLLHKGHLPKYSTRKDVEPEHSHGHHEPHVWSTNDLCLPDSWGVHHDQWVLSDDWERQALPREQEDWSLSQSSSLP